MGIEIIYGIGAVALLFALIYGANRWRQRTPAEDRAGDAATRRLYNKK
jgi:hypothetical protein